MDLLNQFISVLTAQKPAPSLATVKNYKADIAKFLRWYEGQFGTFSPQEVTQQTLNAYKAAIATQTNTQDALALRSIERYMSSLRKFFSFLKVAGEIQSSPFEQVASRDTKIEADTWHLKAFKDYLYVYNASHLTIKNYIMDVKQFLKWVEVVTSITPHPALSHRERVIEKDVLKYINTSLLEEYKDRLHHEAGLSPVSINRKLSSLRRYLGWAKQEGFIQEVSQVSKVPNVPKANLHEIATSLHAPRNDNESYSVSKDNNRDHVGGDERRVIGTPRYSKIPPLRLIQRLGHLTSLGFEAALIAPLTALALKLHIIKWHLTGASVFVSPTVIPNSFRDLKKNSSEMLKQVQHDKLGILSVKGFRKEFFAPHAISLDGLPWHKKAIHHIRHTRPKWYKRYHENPISHYFHFAILVIVMTTIGFGMYQAFVNDPAKNQVKAAPVSPPRILSFQGRLTDASDNPITAATQLRFAIYNDLSASGGALLWQELDTVTPDTDGIFSLLLGNNTVIPQSLFGDNAALWIGITVESTDELAPRQQIATVPYATNSELLQGMNPITNAGGATTNVILNLNSSGNLAIGGAAAPTFQATGGTFTIQGTTTVISTVTGSGGNVILAPDGLGKIELQKPIQNSTNNNNIPSALGSVEIDDLFSVLATSSGQSAVTINQDGAGPILSASASGVQKFTVLNSGQLIIPLYNAAGGILYGNSSGVISQTGAGTAAQCLIGGATPTFASCPGGTSDVFWGQANGALFTNNSTVDLLIGGQSTASAKFAVLNVGTGTPTASVSANSGNIATYITGDGTFATTNRQTLTIGNSSAYNTTGNVLINPNGTGNVGIGTTAPRSKLQVTGGNVYVSGLGSGLALDFNSDTNYLAIYGDSSNRLVLTGDANVVYTPNGIQPGTIAHAVNFHYGDITFSKDAGVDTYLRSASQDLRLQSGATYNIQLNPGAGNVGIGNTAPGAKLDLTGSFRTSSTVTFSTFTSNGGPLYTNGSGVLAQTTAGTATQCLLGGTTPTFGSCDTGSTTDAFWSQANGALFPNNSSVDFLIGGQSTASAKFAVLNLNSGTPTGTMSGNFIVMPHTSGANQLGGNVGIGTTAPAARLHVALGTIAGNTDLFQGTWTDLGSGGSRTARFYVQNANQSTVRFSNPLLLDSTLSVRGSIDTNGVTGLSIGVVGTPFTNVYSRNLFSGTGNNLSLGITSANMTIDTLGNVGIGTTAPTGLFHVSGSTTGNALAIFNQTTSNADLLTASASGVAKFTVGNTGTITSAAYTNAGGVVYTSTTGLLGQTAVGTATQCLLGGAIPAFGPCGTGSDAFWDQQNGALYPKNSTVDFLIGGQSTASANFAVLNNNSGIPVASVSGNFIVMKKNGGGGNVGIGTTTPGARLDLGQVANGVNGINIQDGASYASNIFQYTRVDSIPMIYMGRSAAGYGQVQIFGSSASNYVKLTGDGALVIDNGSTATLRFTASSNDIYMQNTTSAGNMYFTGNAGADLTGQVIFKGTGNIGMGTTTPGNKLEVNGNTNILGTNMDSNTTPSTLNVNGAFMNIGDPISAQTFTNGIGIKFHDSGVAHASIKFLGSSDRMDFCGSSATSTLTCAVTPTLSLLGLNTAGGGNIGIGTTTPAGKLIVASGNVGIGITNPSSLLYVYANSATINVSRVNLENAATTGTTTGQSLAFSTYNGASSTFNGVLSAMSNSWSYGTYAANQFNIVSIGTGGLGLRTQGAAPIIFSTGNADADFAAERMRLTSNGNLGIGTTAPAGMLHVTGATTGNALAIFNQTTSNADLLTASASGTPKFTVGNTGSITSAAYTNAGGVIYTATTGLLGQTAVGTASQCLLGGTIPAFGACSTNTDDFWDSANGTLYPTNSTLDLLIGGQSTASANFAVLNNNSGIPVASVSGNFIVMPKNGGGGNVGIGTTTPAQKLDVAGRAFLGRDQVNYWDFAGVATGNALTLMPAGSDATIALNIAPKGASTVNIQRSLLVYGNAIGSGNYLRIDGAAAASPVDISAGGSDTDINLRIDSKGAGHILLQSTATGNVGIGGDTTPNSLFSVGSTSQFQVNSSGAIAAATGITSSGSITFSTFTSNGGPLYTNGSGVLAQTTAGTSTQCLTGGTAPSFQSCNIGPNDFLWTQTNGALYPNNSTVDLLIGSQATTSANFAVLNNAGGIPIASVSGNLIVMPKLGGGGNIGIGTSAPGAKVQIGAGVVPNAAWNKFSIASVDANNGGLFIGQDATHGIVGNWVYNASAGSAYFSFGTFGGSNNIALQESGGNVGIGTTAPSAKFQLNTPNVFSGTSFANSSIATVGNNASIITTDAQGADVGGMLTLGGMRDTAAVNPGIFGGIRGAKENGTDGNTSGYLGFYTLQGTVALAERMRISSTGNVGINTTAPIATLDVRGNLGTTPAASISANSSFAALVVDNRGSGDIFTASSSGLSRFVIKQNGNVGIGTNIPTAKMEINTGNLNAVGLRVKDVSNQAANLIEATRVDDLLLGGIGRGTDGYGQVTIGGSTGGNFAKLQGDGALTIDNGSTAKIRLTASTNDIYLQNTVSAGNIFITGNAGADLTGQLIFKGTGNVGIGTTTPQGNVHINATTNTLAALLVNTTMSNTLFTASASGVAKFTVGNTGAITDAAYTTPGGLLYGTSTGLISQTAAGTGTQCLLGGTTPTFGACGGGLWDQNNGLIYAGNTTVDFAIGGTSTASAKFAVLNVNSGTPVASVSSGVGGTGMYMTADGTLATTRRTTLTIGNSSTYNTTGNVLINPNGTGNVGVGTTNPIYKLDVAGNAGIGAIGASASITLPNTTSGFASSLATNFGANSFTITGASNTITMTQNNITTGGTAYMEVNNGSHYARIGVNTVEALRIINGGNVGIGNTNPLAMLHVGSGGTPTIAATGDGYFQNDLEVDGITNFAGAATFGSTTTLNGITYTWPGSQSSSYVLSTNGSGTLSWIDAAGAAGVNYWNSANGTLYPKIITQDLLLGGTSTASAKFAIINMNSGNPTATISGNLALAVPTTAGANTLDLFNNSTLNIRTSQGGDAGATTALFVANRGNGGNVGIGTTAPANKLHIYAASAGSVVQIERGIAGIHAATYYTPSGALSGSNVQWSTGQYANVNDYRIWSWNGSADAFALTINNGGNVGIGITAPLALLHVGSGGTPTIASTGDGYFQNDLEVDGITNFAGAATFGSTTTLNGLTYTWPGSQTTGYVLQTNGSGTLSWVDASAASAATNYWLQANGALYPKNSTVDFFIGGQATASAKFAVLNMNTGTPVASVSSGVSGTGMYMTADGTLATTKRTTLTIGNSSTYNTTGNVLINPNGTGNVGIGTTAPAQKLDIGGIFHFDTATGMASFGVGAPGTTWGVRFGSATSNNNSIFRDQNTGNTQISAPNGTAIIFTHSGLLANEVMRINTPGNVGIGNTTPLAKLDVTGSASISGNLSMRGSSTAHAFDILDGGTLNFRTSVGGDAGVGTSRLFIASDGNGGNVGIGTTAPAAPFHINTTVQNMAQIFSSHANPQVYIGGSATTGNAMVLSAITGSDYTSIDTYGDSNTIVLKQGGNVGIGGITSPLALLHVGTGGTPGIAAAGDGYFQNDLEVDGLTNFAGAATFGSTTTLNSLTYTWPASQSNGFVLSTNGSGTLTWADPGNLSGVNYWNQANGTLYPKISTQDLLIGGVSTASAKFAFINVNSGNPTASISGNLAIASPTGANPATTYSALNGGTINFQRSPGGDAGLTSSMFINRDGYIGIGTTTPGISVAGTRNYLTIVGGASEAGVFEMGTNATDANGVRIGLIQFSDKNATGGEKRGAVIMSNLDGTTANNRGGQLQFLTKVDNGALGIRMTIDNFGNVGINTTAPIATLDLRGNLGTTPAASISAYSNKFAAMVVDNSGIGDIFTASASGRTRFVIQNNGSVGINTSTPANALDVYASPGVGGSVAATTFKDIAGSFYLTPAAVGNSMAVAGNVGIGTTLPSFKLTVLGSGNMYDLIAHDISLASSSANILSSYKGFNGYTNFSGGIGTGGIGKDSITNAQRLTASGNLVNIGSFQGGETLLTSAGTFAAKVDYTTSSAPNTVAMGDVNGDGYADLVSANFTLSNVSVFINNGAGTFATKVDYTTGTGPRNVAIGDLNGDGKADMAVPNTTAGTVSVFINNGNGTFATKADYTAGTTARTVAIGDLNGDGKADLAVANNGSTTISVLINNGNGTFATKVDYATGTSPFGTAIGDVNGDGFADFAVTNNGTTTVSVFINNPVNPGTFAAKVDYTTGTQPNYVVLGDVSGDGKADMAVANSGSDTASVFINNGNGTFATKVDYATGTGPQGLGIGDVNGDGKADLATGNGGATTTSVLINNGTGTFATKVDYATGTGPRTVVIGDVNGDGKADMAVANASADSVSVFINNKTTMFYAQASTGNVGIGTTAPVSIFHLVNTTSSTPRGIVADQYSTDTASSRLMLRKARGTAGSPSTLSSGDALGNVSFSGHDGSAFDITAVIQAAASQAWTGSAHGTNMQFYTVPDGSTSSSVAERMRIQADGNVGIGTTAPTAQLHIARVSSIATLNVGETAQSAAATDTGWRVTPYSDNNIYIDSKVGTAGVNQFRIAAGTGGSMAWMTVYGATGIVSFNSGGNVGIGTTAPGYSLDIKPSTSVATSLRLQRAASGIDSNIVFSNETPTDIWSIHLNGSSPEQLMIYPTASTNHLVFQVNEAGTQFGNVGIGNTAPGAKLDVTGTAAFSGNSAFGAASNTAIKLYSKGSDNTSSNYAFFADSNNGTTAALYLRNDGLLVLVGSGGTCSMTGAATATNCASDSRLKKNVVTYGDSLSKLMQLRPVNYNWIDPNLDQSTQVGFIAQEVQQIFPDFVSQLPNGYYGLHYEALIIPLVKSIQELNNKVDANSLNTASYSAQLAALENVNLSSTGNLSIAATPDPVRFEIKKNGTVFTQIAALSEAWIANLKVGSLDVKKIMIDGQSLQDYILAVVQSSGFMVQGDEMVAPIAQIDRVYTNALSPLPSGNGAITIDGNLAVNGSATISGKLTASSLQTTDASISGTLRAKNIIADNIEGLNARIATISAATLQSLKDSSSWLVQDPDSGVADAPQNDDFYTMNGASRSALLASLGLLDQQNNFASTSATVGTLIADFGTFNQGLLALGPSSMTDVAVTGQFSVGSIYMNDNSINTLGSDLEIQPLSQGGIRIMGGKISINSNGDVQFGEDVTFAKNVRVNGKLIGRVISPIPDEDLVIELGTDGLGDSRFLVKNATGSAVFQINQKGDITASGSANIAKLNINLVKSAFATGAGDLMTFDTAGVATISASRSEITIYNKEVTDKSLIYITPVGTPGPSGTYLMRQKKGESFTVGGASNAIFNWLIIN